ncbi:MAG: hypothetical protein JXB49_26460 [Bacteroidales bacterium]|nr:hypothetical protein [Bacteroidales bacterium]
MNSCIEEDENPAKAEGYVIDIITHERLGNTEIRILEWRESWFSGSGDPYSIIKETGYTDTDGHFLVKYFSNPKYEYTLGIFRELYFEEDRFTLPLQYNFVKLGIFPKGFIKTHVTNRIDTARFIEFFYTPYFNSQEVYRYGFENCNILTAAFTDTTFITTTVGGVTNNLKILYYYCDSTLDNIVAKDTSFSTRIHDTVHLNINLY